MKNNRGQFMALYIPILTLFMCALVAGMYYIQNSSLDNHLVSPVEVLKLGDEKQVFELAEKEWACSAHGIAGDDKVKFQEEFCRLFSVSDKSNFIFENYVDSGGVDKSSSFIGSGKSGAREDFCMTNYKFESVDGGVKVSLSNVRKMKRLDATKKDVINFVVDFGFVYKKEDIISLEGCGE